MRNVNNRKLIHLEYKYLLLFFVFIIIFPSINIFAKKELNLNKAQLTEFLKNKIAAKLEATFIASANSAEGTVRDATYFNEIFRDYESLDLEQINFAETAVKLYRGYQESLKKDAEENDSGKRNNATNFLKGEMKSLVSTTLSSLLDKASQAIVGSLKDLWDDAQSKFDKIRGVKKYLAKNPTADAVQALRDVGLDGHIIDDMEFLEVNYKGFKNKFSGYIEALGALKTVAGALRSKNPGDKIEVLFSLGAEFGGRIPVLGKFVELYFKVAQEMINACKGLGNLLRKREQFCVGGETTGQLDTIGGDPRNIQWMKQFPNRQSCPINQVGLYHDIYKETENSSNIFFWVGNRFIAGRQHGGLIDLQALIKWLRRNNYREQATDVKFLSKAYNIPPCFIKRQKQIEKMAKNMQKEIHRIARQMLCKSETIEKFLLNKMNLKGIMDDLGIDYGLVRYFPLIQEIVDKVIEDRIIKKKAGFYNKCRNVLVKLKNTMAFRVYGSVKDGNGNKLSNIQLDVSPSDKMIEDCSDATTRSSGIFKLVFTKTIFDSFQVSVKATNKNQSKEESVKVSGTKEDYKCNISFGKSDLISINISPAEKTINKGSSLSFVVIGVNRDGATDVIPVGKIQWTRASGGIFTGKNEGTFTITAKYEGKSAQATIIVEEKPISINLSPSDMKIEKGSKITYVVTEISESGESQVIPNSEIVWTGASSGVFSGDEIGMHSITAVYKGNLLEATVRVEEKIEDLEDALDNLGNDIENDPCKADIATLVIKFQGIKAGIEQKFEYFMAVSSKFFQEINVQRADPCTNQMVAFTYYNGKKISGEVVGMWTKIKTLYSRIIFMSAACKLNTTKDTVKTLLYDFSDIGPKIGTINRTLGAMQAKLGALSCDENEVNNKGQQVTAQGTIDPNLLQHGGGMTEIQNDSLDNTGEGLQDEQNYSSALLIMVWDSGSAKDDIFSVSLSGFGTLGTTPKGSRQVFSKDRIAPGTYTASITTLETDVGAGTWSVIVSYKGKTLVPATSGANSGSVSFVIHE